MRRGLPKSQKQSAFVSLDFAIVLLFLCGFQIGRAGTWTATGSLLTGRDLHTATLLTNGQVLVTGGEDRTWIPIASAEIYNPETGIWRATSPLGTARYRHTATLLSNGMVLVAGGWNKGLGYLDSTELYDPATETWKTTGSLITGRYEHTATLIAGGAVLVFGGYSPLSGALASAELFESPAGIWASISPSITRRVLHTGTLLSDGTVLVVGGSLGSYLNSADLYSPATGTWSHAGTLADARELHAATLLSNGKVLVVGGLGVQSNIVGTLASAELYNPTYRAWTRISQMSVARSSHTATLLHSGKVLVAAGNGGDPTSEIYDPSTGRWGEGTRMKIPYALGQHTATLLPSGKVLVAGGSAGPFSSGAYAELYDESNTPAPPKLAGVQLINNSFQFSFTNTPGAVFSVLAAEDLTFGSNNWTVLGTATEIEPGLFQFTDGPPISGGHRFYRISY